MNEERYYGHQKEGYNYDDVSKKSEESFMALKCGWTRKEIISYVKSRMKEVGLKIKDEGFIKYDRSRAQRHYAAHFRGSYENATHFYKELEDYIVSDKVYGFIVEGKDAVKIGRQLIDPKEHEDEAKKAMTIRVIIPKILGLKEDKTSNVMHASDNAKSAQEEIAIYKELRAEYKKAYEQDRDKQ